MWLDIPYHLESWQIDQALVLAQMAWPQITNATRIVIMNKPIDEFERIHRERWLAEHQDDSAVVAIANTSITLPIERVDGYKLTYSSRWDILMIGLDE